MVNQETEGTTDTMIRKYFRGCNLKTMFDVQLFSTIFNGVEAIPPGYKSGTGQVGRLLYHAGINTLQPSS